ncbi:S41 family peptidase [Chungangia koreensis]|uniref:S41 family peptidase n=1 Tax=Chungangia koreensis TaxID=752657 RepID=A0ABV8X6W1_9LACT
MSNSEHDNLEEQEPVKSENAEKVEEEKSAAPANRYIRIKPFYFLMLLFGLILLTAGITIFALTAGDDKVVEVGSVTVERNEFQKLFETYDQLKEEYYSDLNDEELVNGAINGMIDALGDPYSDYMNQEEAGHLNETISSSFEGIGAEIQERNGFITVVSPIKNSPAEKAGIIPNDRIIAVDGQNIQGKSASEAVLLIRGEKGTDVKLTIQRGENSEPMEVTITRDEIPIETVYSEMLADGVAHIQITSFSQHTYEELKDAIAKMEEEGMKAMVLDVRQNPGGLLNAAIEISNLFVNTGDPILQVQEKDKEPEVFVATEGLKVKVPFALLIDEGSASASEILAGALKESAGAPLVGLKTFGKGTVQTANDLPDGSNLKFTTAKWLTPEGNWIHEKGIAPDYKVDYPKYASLPFLDPSIELKNGMLSSSIQAAEEMLTAVGYDPGKVDGLYDDSTEEAVKALQDDQKIKVDGVLKGDTTYALMDQLRQKVQKDDPQLLKAKEVLLQELGRADSTK